MTLPSADQARVAAALDALHQNAEAPPTDVRRAAVAVLLRGPSLHAAEVLLMQRAMREGDRWSGQISLPGGHEEPEDTDLIATARRESVEEVGVDPGEPHATVFGAMPTVQARASGERIGLYITPVVFHRREVGPTVLGPEAAGAFWVPLASLNSSELERPYRYRHREVVHVLPSWEFQGHRIWGMTHGILSRFVSALRFGSE